jgi:hypothetical protein
LTTEKGHPKQKRVKDYKTTKIRDYQKQIRDHKELPKQNMDNQGLQKTK